tara:strand:+ start:3458 stop:3841 length:384 start_codon:yes stop_codon:yes gene_type:complete
MNNTTPLDIAFLGALFLEPIPEEESVLQYAKRCRDAGCVLSLDKLAYIWTIANILMLEGKLKDAEAEMIRRQTRMKERFDEGRAPKPEPKPESGYLCADECCPVCDPEEEEEESVTLGEAFSFLEDR